MPRNLLIFLRRCGKLFYQSELNVSILRKEDKDADSQSFGCYFRNFSKDKSYPFSSQEWIGFIWPPDCTAYWGLSSCLSQGIKRAIETIIVQ